MRSNKALSSVWLCPVRLELALSSLWLIEGFDDPRVGVCDTSRFALEVSTVSSGATENEMTGRGTGGEPGLALLYAMIVFLRFSIVLDWLDTLLLRLLFSSVRLVAQLVTISPAPIVPTVPRNAAITICKRIELFCLGGTFAIYYQAMYTHWNRQRW